MYFSLVIRQKADLKTGVTRKQITPNLPKNEHFLPSVTYTYVSVSGGNKWSFFGTFGMLCCLVTPVLRFALLPYYRRIHCLKVSTEHKNYAACFLS